MAKPDATLVAGFNQWKRLGRMVKQGEKAIRIMAPCPVQRENPTTGNKEERLFFRTACVWDVSQTSGKDLSKFEVPDVQIAAEDLLRKFELVAAQRGIQLVYRQLAVCR